jgi:hypothetical protein
MYVEPKGKRSETYDDQEPEIDWRSVLYHGDDNGTMPLNLQAVTVEKENR